MITLNQILIDVNAFLDLTAEVPSGDDLTVRINYGQQSVREWGRAYQWRQLKEARDYFATGATIPLSSNYSNLTSPLQDIDGNYYPEVTPEEHLEIIRTNSSDRHCYYLGSPMTSQYLVVNGLTAAATLSWIQQRYPSNMATLSDVCEIPDPDFVKEKIISYVLQSRLDERFPTIEAKANQILQSMIGRETIVRPGGENRVRRIGAAAYRIGSR